MQKLFNKRQILSIIIGAVVFVVAVIVLTDFQTDSPTTVGGRSAKQVAVMERALGSLEPGDGIIIARPGEMLYAGTFSGYGFYKALIVSLVEPKNNIELYAIGLVDEYAAGTTEIYIVPKKFKAVVLGAMIGAAQRSILEQLY